MQPANDCIIVEPLPEAEQVGGGVKTPESALFLGKAKVVDVGNATCVYEGNVLLKSEIIPSLAVGKIVHYIKMGEERLSEDAIYRIKTTDTSYNLIMPLKYIRGIE